MEHTYRYPGTQPFQEEDWYLFFGRDREKADLVEMIQLEQVVVLFGKSGYGKSSLLNAAVIPFLRRFERYEVHSVRLVEPRGENDRKRSPLEVLEARLQEASGKLEFPFPGFDIPSALPEDHIARLWYYLKKIELANPDSNTVTLVFDQFEELRQFSEAQIEELGEALNALLYLQTPRSVRQLISEKLESDRDFLNKAQRRALLRKLGLKLVFSLHHDRLNLLDKLKGYIPDIFKFTYELKPLDSVQALEALQKPAALGREFSSPVFTYTKEAGDYILSKLKDSKNGLIEPFQLQLLAQHAEQKMIAREKKNDARAKKTAADRPKEPYVVGIDDLDDPKTIYKKHYRWAIATLPWLKQERARNLIQKGLIIEGNRIPLPEPVISRQYEVSRNSLETLQETHLLRSEQNSTQGTSWELSHDSLIEPILDSAERRKRRRLWLIVIGIFLAVVGALVAWALMERNAANKERERLIKEQEKVILIRDSLETVRSALTNGIIINPLVIAKVNPVPAIVNEETVFTYRIMEAPGDVIVQSVRWRFGDGDSSSIRTIGASSSRFDTITHRYQKVDTLTAELVVVDDSGVERVDPVTIQVIERDTLHAQIPNRTLGILAVPSGGPAPVSIQFSLSDTLFRNPSDYQWKVDGRVFSNEASASFDFENPGRYRVTLDLRDDDDVIVEPREIVIGPSPTGETLPRADAYPKQAQGVAPFMVEFQGDASLPADAGLEYLWKLESGETSDEPNPVHTYKTPGDYSVILTVRDTQGKESRDTVRVTVKPDAPPIARAVATFNNGRQQAFQQGASAAILGKAPFAVDFDAENSEDDRGLVSYEWDFGDGITASGMRVNHTFINGRVHRVELTVQDVKGQTASTFLQVGVSYPLVSAEVNYRKWLQRFVEIQNTKLVGNRRKADTWEDLIPPDSLNLVGIYLDEPSAIPSVGATDSPDLLFFFTPNGSGKLYKFRSDVSADNIDTAQTVRYSLKSLIETTARNAKRNTDNEGLIRTRKLMLPNDSVAGFGEATYQNLAQLFDRNKINNKTINFYYTLIPYSLLSATSQREVREFYQLLGEPK